MTNAKLQFFPSHSGKKRAAATCLTVLLAVFLLVFPAQAAGADILQHNSQMSRQWVNWCPSSFTLSEPVQALADQLAAQADDRTQAARAVHDWVCREICYDWDAFYNIQYGALRAEDVLRDKRAVCEGIANLVQALCLSMDIPCIKVWGICTPEGQGWSEAAAASQRITHTWNEFYLNGRWIAVDCTMDMKNSFRDGVYTYAPHTSSYFDPEDNFFAQSHKVLQRGYDLPEDIPADWALPGIQRAVDLDLIPLSMLSRYAQPVTSDQFRALFDLEGGTDDLITRREAAVLLAQVTGESPQGPLPYWDMNRCSPRERSAAAALFRRGIMTGTGGSAFSPDKYLTRQEAILIALRIFEEGT